MRLLWILCLVGCGGRDEAPWCSAGDEPVGTAPESPTYHHDVAPILEARCARCHEDGGIAPFALGTYDEVVEHAEVVAISVEEREMPPFLAASCCNDYFSDFSLTPDQIATIRAWVDAGAPEGEADEPPAESLPTVGGLSRVDVEVEMPDAYTPSPPAGRTDDVRCFVLDWPVAEKKYITGLEPVPGNRAVVHHLVVAAVGPDDLDELPSEGDDGAPGFPCEGGFGGVPLGKLVVLGGSLLGSDFPDGLGRAVEPGSKLVLNIHYTTATGGIGEDKTRIRFKLDDHARGYQGIAVSNLAWMVDDGMHIEAGDPDAVFWYWYEPTAFTRGEPVDIRSVTPHMHYFGSQILVRIVREDGSRKCLLEIPDWHFGWEQPYWLAEPVRLEPGDQLYLECHFDNSAAHQPTPDPPRDIAWGNSNQDMCAAFLSFTR